MLRVSSGSSDLGNTMAPQYAAADPSGYRGSRWIPCRLSQYEYEQCDQFVPQFFMCVFVCLHEYQVTVLLTINSICHTPIIQAFFSDHSNVERLIYHTNIPRRKGLCYITVQEQCIGATSLKFIVQQFF